MYNVCISKYFLKLYKYMSAPTPAAATGDSSMGPVGKAMILAFIVLALINGNMPANTQFALVIGVAAYFYFKKDAHA